MAEGRKLWIELFEQTFENFPDEIKEIEEVMDDWQ